MSSDNHFATKKEEALYFVRQLKFFDKKLNAYFLASEVKEDALKQQLTSAYQVGMDVVYVCLNNRGEQYQNLDFVSFCKMRQCTYLCDRIPLKKGDTQKAHKIYQEFIKDFNLASLRSLKEFENMQNANYSQFYLLKNGGKLIGYHYIDSLSGHNELVTLDQSIYIESGYPCFQQSEHGRDSHMIRCVNVLNLLKKCKVKREVSLNVVDPVIAQNNLSLLLTKNNVKIADKGELTLPIKDLTNECFGYGKQLDLFEHKKNINFEKCWKTFANLQKKE